MRGEIGIRKPLVERTASNERPTYTAADLLRQADLPTTAAASPLDVTVNVVD